MGKSGDGWRDKEERTRHVHQEKGSVCQDCGSKNGRRRFEHEFDLGMLCDACWKEYQYETGLLQEH